MLLEKKIKPATVKNVLQAGEPGWIVNVETDGDECAWLFTRYMGVKVHGVLADTLAEYNLTLDAEGVAFERKGAGLVLRDRDVPAVGSVVSSAVDKATDDLDRMRVHGRPIIGEGTCKAESAGIAFFEGVPDGPIALNARFVELLDAAWPNAQVRGSGVLAPASWWSDGRIVGLCMPIRPPASGAGAASGAGGVS